MSCILLGDFESFSRLNIPMFLERGSAGFPSPAEDYVEPTIDLNELCVQHPAATFFVRVQGESMIEAGIYPGDVLVDWSLKGKHGKSSAHSSGEGRPDLIQCLAGRAVRPGL